MTAYGLYQHHSTSCPDSITGDAGVFFLTLLNTLFANQCQLGNKIDYPPDAGDSLIDNDIFDYIIVGAGTTGSVLASRLAQTTNNKILLLEAGGYPSPTSDIPALHLSLQKTIEDWQFRTEKFDGSCLGFKNGRCLLPSGKVLGGSNTINSMLYLRGSRHSFNTWSENGNVGWSYQTVNPYFKRSEKLEAHELITSNLYGINGTLPLTRNRSHQPLKSTILDSVKELGYKVTSHEIEVGFFEALQTIQQGVRQNTAKVFLGDHETLSNLKVVTEALVEKILMDKETKEANGVKVNVAGRTLRLYAEKEVVVSAGPINSPKLLMLSGIGPKQHLGSQGIDTIHDLNVGGTLKDHLMYPLFTVKLNKSSIKNSHHNPTDELFNYFENRDGVFANTALSNIVGLLNTKNHSKEANVKFNYLFVPYQDSYLLSQYKKNFNFDEAIMRSLIDANKHSPLLIIYITLLDVKSKGKVLLKSKNPHDKPMIHTNYFSEEKDLDEMLKAIRIAEKQVETSFFRKKSAELVKLDVPNCRKHKFRSDDYWKCNIRNVGTTGYSPYGTCKMGLSIDPEAVVDPLLRVHGVEKLRVIDTSVIPMTTRSDLAATAMMIGQKGAQIILNGFKELLSEEM